LVEVKRWLHSETHLERQGMGDEINFAYKTSKIGNEFIAAYATVWNEPDNS